MLKASLFVNIFVRSKQSSEANLGLDGAVGRAPACSGLVAGSGPTLVILFFVHPK